MKIIKIRDNHPRARGESFRKVGVISEDDKTMILLGHVEYEILKSQIEIKQRKS